ncbi:hypothetical protein AB0L80_41830 [Streptomyces sp. NPDC052069]|uniref:hypothetical protein n=1 Tax=Streptomyces sp. NPDC052069 TaxID=3154650 RepID=UPI00342CF3C8
MAEPADESVVVQRIAEGLDHVERFHPEAADPLAALQVVTIRAEVASAAEWNEWVSPCFPRLPVGQEWSDYEAERLSVRS